MLIAIYASFAIWTSRCASPGAQRYREYKQENSLSIKATFWTSLSLVPSFSIPPINASPHIDTGRSQLSENNQPEQKRATGACKIYSVKYYPQSKMSESEYKQQFMLDIKVVPNQ